jgi:hypothetical protein
MELQRAECPNCAAGLDLTAGLSKGVIACHNCGSVLDASSEDLAILANVASGEYDPVYPIKLGQDWNWRGKAYRVTGRLRYRYAEGFWDEWFCVADDGTVLWLEDDEGDLRALDPYTPSDAPERAMLEDSSLSSYTVDGGLWEVKERSTATIEWFEGQLSWRVKPGTEVRSIDLRQPGQQLAIEWTKRELEYYRAYDIGSAPSASAGASSGSSKGGIFAGGFGIAALVVAGVFIAMCACCCAAPQPDSSSESDTYYSGDTADAGVDDAGRKRRRGGGFFYGGGRGGSGGSRGSGGGFGGGK